MKRKNMNRFGVGLLVASGLAVYGDGFAPGTQLGGSATVVVANTTAPTAAADPAAAQTPEAPVSVAVPVVSNALGAAPTALAAPEPSEGLMVLSGLGLVALGLSRRPRSVAAK